MICNSVFALVFLDYFSFLHYSVNGVPACANKMLLTDVLRKAWNFTGFVISDSGMAHWDKFLKVKALHVIVS